MHYLIGNIGHFSVLAAFVTSILCAFAFGWSQRTGDRVWKRYATGMFYLHAASILSIVVCLFIIIHNHYFEYYYAYNYSSRILPYYYQISSFWNGQEGSFLLWMFWNILLGLILVHTNTKWRPSVMMVFSITQIFLTSMILGVVFPGLKIGSSPFILLRDAMQDPIFSSNPDFVPPDGRGLNPLLQNYWMVIHPPTLFLGFATTVVPFSFCIAGLITRQYKDWIRPAIPWALFSAAVLGIGILMGAYWAYETLNFGGYWNWDPVENAIYVPWLVLVAGIHTMIAYRKSENALKASIILSITTYVLIVYSTFLTRSGVLGNSSVHSFTDLGLSGQLLFYLFAFFLFSLILVIVRWPHIPSSKKEVSAYSREFWIFMGATLLCLMAFQVIMSTSIPVYNEILEFFGGTSNLAPPTDPVEFYSRFQVWFAVILAILSGTGQFFWWNKMDKAKLKRELTGPVLLALAISAVIFLIARIHQPSYILLLTASTYSIVANLKILMSLVRSNFSLSGGSIAHTGLALMLIGILFSSGYSKILSKNNTGLIWNTEFPEEVNRDNLLLFINEPRQMGDFTLTYKGLRKKTRDHGYVNAYHTVPTTDPLQLTVSKSSESSNGMSLKVGDTLSVVNPENSYFEVEYRKADDRTFTLYPRVQINETMDMTVFSPDIQRSFSADIYSHVRTFPDPDQETDWSATEEIKVSPGTQFFLNDYVAQFLEIQRINEIRGIPLNPGDVAVKAIIDIQGESTTYRAEPIYLIREQMAAKIPEVVPELAARITIEAILPQENSFVFGINTTQKDWIIIEVVEKPWINILWLGTLILTIGFGVAVYRRYREFVLTRDR